MNAHEDNQLSGSEQAINQRPTVLYPPDAYQKMLDYHVAEIILTTMTTIAFAIIFFIRHHH